MEQNLALNTELYHMLQYSILYMYAILCTHQTEDEVEKISPRNSTDLKEADIKKRPTMFTNF